MVRTAIIISLPLLLFAAGSHAAEPAWPKIEALDWIAADEGEGVKMFVNPGPPAEMPRMWVRYEWRQAQDGKRSSAALYESNCKTFQIRSIQSTYYEKNNLAGLGDTRNTSFASWSYPLPGTLGDKVLKLTCAVAEAKAALGADTK